MNISIKEYRLKDTSLGNTGIQFDVYTTKDEYLGDLRISKGGVEWCKGKAQSGVKFSWEKFIALFKED